MIRTSDPFGTVGLRASSSSFDLARDAAIEGCDGRDPRKDQATDRNLHSGGLTAGFRRIAIGERRGRRLIYGRAWSGADLRTHYRSYNARLYLPENTGTVGNRHAFEEYKRDNRKEDNRRLHAEVFKRLS